MDRESWDRARAEAAFERRPGLTDPLAHRLEPVWRHVFGMRGRRTWLGLRSPRGPLRDYYLTPYGATSAPWSRIEYLALDIEATGLDPDRDEILSIGYVPIIDGRLKLAEAGYTLVRPRQSVPEATAVLHGILDGHLTEAPRLSAVFPSVLRALTGRVLVAHHARLERTFLSRACRRLYGQPLDLPFVDTLDLEYAHLQRTGTSVVPGELRLARARLRHGLPRYRAHNALTDAIAAGELLLALAETAPRPLRLRDLLG